MIVLFVIDLQHQILPNVITVPGIVIGFVLSFVPAARVAVVAARHCRSVAACSSPSWKPTRGRAASRGSGWAT